MPLVGPMRTCDQKLTPGLMLPTFMTVHLFQFHFAVTEHPCQSVDDSFVFQVEFFLTSLQRTFSFADAHAFVAISISSLVKVRSCWLQADKADFYLCLIPSASPGTAGTSTSCTTSARRPMCSDVSSFTDWMCSRSLFDRSLERPRVDADVDAPKQDGSTHLLIAALRDQRGTVKSLCGPQQTPKRPIRTA